MFIAEQEQRFADWLRDHSAVLHHVINGFAAGDDRNDLLQEVLLAVWKSIPALFVIMLPLLVLSMQQLHAVGKVSARELVSMAALFTGVLLLSGAGIAARYFGRLLPQQRQLHALLAELADETA